MATMKTLNGYGFNATEFNGKTSDSYLLKTDTAANSADSQKLGGKAPEYYIQPRNLLDNSDFTNPVNQRGKTSYSGGYGIDRWKQWSNSHTTTINDNSISISIIQQYIGSNIDFDKTYTIAAKKVDSSILCEIGTFNGKLNKNGLRIDYDTNTDGTKKPYIAINEAGDYVWAALYEGSYTADTLPPYVPKGYAAELAECLRYFEIQEPNTELIPAQYDRYEITVYYYKKRVVSPTIGFTSNGSPEFQAYQSSVRFRTTTAGIYVSQVYISADL